MLVLRVRNVNDAFKQGVSHLMTAPHAPCRGGRTVLRYPEPVATVYERPLERVLWNAKRDANPFFHVVEAMWMLNGQWDVKTVATYASSMASFSDDGLTLRGAYGLRWRAHFGGIDQVTTIARMLREDPTTRRAVLQIWDAALDLGVDSKDIPCNLTAAFSVRNGTICMTVFCRSNDMIWGAYGANAVHFSFLLECVAALAGLPVGTMTQISNDFHAYTDVWERQVDLIHVHDIDDRYETEGLTTTPLVAHPATFLRTLYQFMLMPGQGECDEPFLENTVRPMRAAWAMHRDFGETGRALQFASDNIESADWRAACVAWLERRQR